MRCDGTSSRATRSTSPRAGQIQRRPAPERTLGKNWETVLPTAQSVRASETGPEIELARPSRAGGAGGLALSQAPEAAPARLVHLFAGQIGPIGRGPALLRAEHSPDDP